MNIPPDPTSFGDHDPLRIPEDLHDIELRLKHLRPAAPRIDLTQLELQAQEEMPDRYQPVDIGKGAAPAGPKPFWNIDLFAPAIRSNRRSIHLSTGRDTAKARQKVRGRRGQGAWLRTIATSWACGAVMGAVGMMSLSGQTRAAWQGGSVTAGVPVHSQQQQSQAAPRSSGETSLPRPEQRSRPVELARTSAGRAADRPVETRNRAQASPEESISFVDEILRIATPRYGRGTEWESSQLYAGSYWNHFSPLRPGNKSISMRESQTESPVVQNHQLDVSVPLLEPRPPMSREEMLEELLSGEYERLL